MSHKKIRDKAIEIERQGEDSWESALSDSLKKAADEVKPSDKVMREVEKHYSSPDVPLAPEDRR